MFHGSWKLQKGKGDATRRFDGERISNDSFMLYVALGDPRDTTRNLVYSFFYC